MLPEKKQILVVDDEANLRRVLSAQLSRDGYEVHTAEDGEEGLAFLKEHHIDLVITDDLGVSVLKGSGNNNGDFSAFPLQRPALANADRISNPMLADLNHDGKLDIVVGVHESGNFGGTDYFEVLQNIGFGSFILVGQYEVSYSGLNNGTTREAQLADIDGDGDFDLVFIDTVVGGTVSWLKGAGNGTFAPQVPLLGAGGGVGNMDDIEVADIDGDGKLDLLMQNMYG